MMDEPNLITTGTSRNSRSRSGRSSDLIDLSQEIRTNLLDHFDPLCENETTTNKQKDPRQQQSNSAKLKSSQSIKLDIRNRRPRAASARPASYVIDSRGLVKADEQLNNNIQCDAPHATFQVLKTEIATRNSSPNNQSDGPPKPPDVDDDVDDHHPKNPRVSHSDDLLSSETTMQKSTNRNDQLKLSRKHQRSSQEVVELARVLKSFRTKFKHDSKVTNPGIVFSPTIHSLKVRDMSVKIIIISPMANEPINFTCNVSTTIEHLISHAVCSMFESLKDSDSMENYMLKVSGTNEYLDPMKRLMDYSVTNNAIKYGLDVQLTLVRVDNVKRSFSRTSQDDFHCNSRLCPDDLLSRSAILRYSDLNYESLSIIIETFDKEAERLYQDVTNKKLCLQTQKLIQTTKAICSLMLNCETSQLTESKNNLSELCRSYNAEGDHLRDEDRYKMIEVIQHAIKRLTKNMHRLLKLTSQCLPVDYEVDEIESNHSMVVESFVSTPLSSVKEQVSLKLQLVAQLKPDWLAKYHEYYMAIDLYHGVNPLSLTVVTQQVRVDTSFFPRALFDEELILPIAYSVLPREARFVISLFGIELPPVQAASNHLTVTGLPVVDDSVPMRRWGSASSVASTVPMYSSSPRNSIYRGPNTKGPSEPVKTLLATGVVYLLDHELNLRQGESLVHLHQVQDQSTEDLYIETIADKNDPILILEFRKFPPEKRIFFSKQEDFLQISEDAKLNETNHDLDQLDSRTRKKLERLIHRRHCYEVLSEDEKQLVWEHRMYLKSVPAALPKVLLSAPSWSIGNLSHLYNLINNWQPLDAVDALELLLPSFPDTHIRGASIRWISKLDDDELYDYIPQLLQAFRFERSIDCPLLWLLLDRAMTNVRVAGIMYWGLKVNSCDKVSIERSETIKHCLLWACGSAFWKAIDKQEDLLNKLTRISQSIKKSRDGQRMNVLTKKLEMVQDDLMEKKPTLPWAPGLEVCDLSVKNCSYFPSNTLPLKLAFRSCEESCNRAIKFYTYDTIFKMGDDLRQDMLAIQMIRIMEKLWLREGLDLSIVSFDCIATDERQGMIEMVRNAETLRKIQQSGGILTGAFNVKAIDNYIRLWNTSELEYKTALDKFLHSCAGYSVATYILGICDRHNDNIMVTTSGHLFHIDFGKFLGDAQMMGSIKRDRTPFVLTADMAYVINGGDKPSKKFQTFIELCTMGFNIIRRHRNLFLNLFSLMSSAKINGLDSGSIGFVDQQLMPDLSEAEAMAKFTRLIDECLHSRSTQVNFFIHNLAQLRFSNDNPKDTLLSFVPKTFSISTDGRIESLDIVHFYKRYEPEKIYYYVVRVGRSTETDATNITRTFREFSELQMKLNCMFPCSNFHDINRSEGSFLMDIVGRNNTREVAERRLFELRTFLKKLLKLPPEISHCDLIYTFFHPILRDQTGTSLDASTSSAGSTSILAGSQPEYSESQRNALYLGSNGQVKISLSYANNSLIIMIMHAKNLESPEHSLPNCYAKCYLLPDPQKQTKRKTRVVRQSSHPSFMEMIVYKINRDTLRRLTLQVSIWHSEIVQNKVFMGAALIPLDSIELSKETTTAWYPLKNF